MHKKISKMLRKIKKPRTSKLLMYVFCALFIYAIIFCLNYNYSDSSIQDVSILGIALTVLGSIVGVIVCHYLNNSNSENIPKIQLGLYKEAMKLRLEYNEEMLKLRQAYGVTDDDISEIENDGDMDEITNNIMSNAISELDSRSAKAHEDVTI